MKNIKLTVKQLSEISDMLKKEAATAEETVEEKAAGEELTQEEVKLKSN